MKLSDFDYNLPEELIAQHPTDPRDHSRLLVLNIKTGKIEHTHFYDLTRFLNRGDVLVLNDSKVFPARLVGAKETGGKVEILLNKELKPGLWEVMGRNLKIGSNVNFSQSTLAASILEKIDQIYLVKFNLSGSKFFDQIEKIGLTPLPPYIKREKNQTGDKINYQTVYADKIGSAAAPTAGLHFTEELLEKLKIQGVEIVFVTLNVGLGTFAPIKTDEVTEHKIHEEYYSISQESYEKIIQSKKKHKKIIAVGTTTTRVLEHIINHPKELSGWTKIFIYPGYKLKCIDSLITNFHLPKSTLLLLVFAFAGSKNIKKSYQVAIRKKYRFYSYGDAMLIV